MSAETWMGVAFLSLGICLALLAFGLIPDAADGRE